MKKLLRAFYWIVLAGFLLCYDVCSAEILLLASLWALLQTFCGHWCCQLTSIEKINENNKANRIQSNPNPLFWDLAAIKPEGLSVTLDSSFKTFFSYCFLCLSCILYLGPLKRSDFLVTFFDDSSCSPMSPPRLTPHMPGHLNQALPADRSFALFIVALLGLISQKSASFCGAEELFQSFSELSCFTRLITKS